MLIEGQSNAGILTQSESIFKIIRENETFFTAAFRSSISVWGPDTFSFKNCHSQFSTFLVEACSSSRRGRELSKYTKALDLPQRKKVPWKNMPKMSLD